MHVLRQSNDSCSHVPQGAPRVRYLLFCLPEMIFLGFVVWIIIRFIFFLTTKFFSHTLSNKNIIICIINQSYDVVILRNGTVIKYGKNKICC